MKENFSARNMLASVFLIQLATGSGVLKVRGGVANPRPALGVADAGASKAAFPRWCVGMMQKRASF